MAYQYRAYTLDKMIVQGTIDAPSESMAEETLYRAGYRRVLSLREIRPRLTLERLLPSLFGVKSRVTGNVSFILSIAPYTYLFTSYQVPA